VRRKGVVRIICENPRHKQRKAERLRTHMARIGWSRPPPSQAHRLRLAYLYGVGHALARVICRRANIAPTKLTESLTEGEIKPHPELLETDYNEAISGARCRRTSSA